MVNPCPSIYFAYSVEQDQPARTCNLILLCTLRYSLSNCCQRHPHLMLCNRPRFKFVRIMLDFNGGLLPLYNRLLLICLPVFLLNSLPNNTILDLSKFKAFADVKMILTQNFKSCWKQWKHCGKRRKCWLPAFSPFPTMFSKAVFSRGVKSRDCVVKGYFFTRVPKSSD